MEKIGRYEILRELGRGAMGIVYLAEDTALSRQVALKTLWPHLTQDESLVERFRREARAAAGISHPNVVALHDVGDLEDGGNYIVMEHVEGKTLQDVLKGKRVELADALRWFRQILAGLKAAHLVGVIHRDLKPSNILVRDSDDAIKLTDFGLARFAQDQTMLTHVSEMLGTPEFLAPEIPRGESADARTDLYAAGVIFYRMLTGEAPFRGPSLTAVIQAHEQGRYAPAGTIAQDLSPQYDIVISQLLAGDRAERYPDADAVLTDLDRIERGDPIVRIAPRRVEPAVISSSPSSTSAGPVRRIAEWTATWVKFQYLEIFGRTSGTMIVIRGTVEQYEEECAQAHERLQQAVLLRNAIIEELDQLRAASEELASSAERRMIEGDEPAARDLLKRKVSLVADRKRLEAEKVEAASLVNQTREDYERISRDLGSLKRRADLLSMRRSRAKQELSIFGRLNGDNGRGTERLAAAAKLAAVLFVLIGLTTTGIWASGSIFRRPVETVEPANPPVPVTKKIYVKPKERELKTVVRNDIRNITNHTNPSDDPSTASLFPDDETIVYNRKERELVTMRLDGGPFTSIPNTQLNQVNSPRVSPDGRRIVFVNYIGQSEQEVWTVMTDGAEPAKVAVVPFALGGVNPIWNTDGKSVIFMRGNSFVKKNADGSGSETVLFTDMHASMDLSADGGLLVYSTTSGIKIRELNTGTDYALTSNSNDQAPRFSDDGELVFYTRVSGSNRDVFVKNTDGSGPEVNLTNTPTFEQLNDVTRDLRRFLWEATYGGNDDIFSQSTRLIFDLPTPVKDPEKLRVLVNGTLQSRGTDYTFVNAATIRFTTSAIPSEGDVITFETGNDG